MKTAGKICQTASEFYCVSICVNYRRIFITVIGFQYFIVMTVLFYKPNSSVVISNCEIIVWRDRLLRGESGQEFNNWFITVRCFSTDCRLMAFECFSLFRAVTSGQVLLVFRQRIHVYNIVFRLKSIPFFTHFWCFILTCAPQLRTCQTAQMLYLMNGNNFWQWQVPVGNFYTPRIINLPSIFVLCRGGIVADRE